MLQVENTGRSVFGKECTERLLAEVEMMLYFGIHRGLKHPKSPKLSKFKMQFNSASLYCTYA